MREPDDRELAARLARGDHAALDAIMGRYKKRLYQFIRRYLRDDEAAYDVLQETFIRLFYHAGRYDPAYRFSTWLYQIALNLCRDHARKHRNSLHAPLTGEEPGGPEGDAERAAGSRQELILVQREIARLPHKLKAALVAFAVEENSRGACAEILGISPRAVEARVYRARKILSEKLLKENKK